MLRHLGLVIWGGLSSVQAGTLPEHLAQGCVMRRGPQAARYVRSPAASDEAPARASVRP